MFQAARFNQSTCAFSIPPWPTFRSVWAGSTGMAIKPVLRTVNVNVINESMSEVKEQE